MDRRFFLKSLMAGSAVATPAIPVLASDFLRHADATKPTLLVCQNDFPAAQTLGAAIATALRQAGKSEVERIDYSATQLRQPARIDAALARETQRHIVGVMDDASALIFHEIAATRGNGCLLQTQHCLTADGARHHCRMTGLDDAMAWSTPVARWEMSLAQLYADILTGQAPRVFDIASPKAAYGSMHASLVSFVLKA